MVDNGTLDGVANDSLDRNDTYHGQNGSVDAVPKPRSYGTANESATESANGSADRRDEEQDSLAPDRTKLAWAFLFGCFWLEGLIWGLPFSYGIFEKYYSHHPAFSSENGIAAVGTTCMGFAYFIGPFTLAALRRWPSQRVNVSVIGLFLVFASLMLASFSTRVIHLVFTQGMLYGTGSALLYNPFLFYMDEWFEKRKGLAYSIFWSGTGISGAVVPFVMEWSLNEYGFRTTLRAWGIFITALLALLVFFLRPPRPLPQHGVKLRMNYAFVKSPLFWAFQAGNIIEGLGYFVPQVYLRSFAKHVDMSDVAAISSISLLNAFSSVGLILMGWLVDRFHISNVLIFSAVTSTLSVFLLWGFATNEVILFAFSVTFGIFAGGYVSSWTGCALEVKKSIPDSDIAGMVGFFAAGRGFGVVLCGPISEALLKTKPLHAVSGYGTRFGALIIFTGVTSLMGRFGLFGKFGLQAEESSPIKPSSPEHDPLIR